VKQVRGARDGKALQATLQRLFSPLGPGIDISQNLPLGIAQHDAYHAGQIQMLKRLARMDTVDGTDVNASRVLRSMQGSVMMKGTITFSMTDWLKRAEARSHFPAA
jgi:hypothetical protein